MHQNDSGLPEVKQIAQLTIFNSAPQQESVIKIECLGNQREPEAVQTHKDHLLVLKNLNLTVVKLMRLGLHHQMHKQIAQFAKRNCESKQP